MDITVAVIGAGRMGSVVARQLPEGTRKILIDTNIEKARVLAEEVGGIPAGSYEAVSEADLIALVIPAPAVSDTLEQLMGSAKAGALMINMATTAYIDPAVKATRPAMPVIDAKIIGHAGAMSEGNPGMVVIKTDDQAIFDLVKSQLPGFQEVVRGDADLVPMINEMSTLEALRIAVNLRNQLRAMDIPEAWITVAIKTVCAGVVKAFADHDLGEFGLRLIKQLEQENT